MSGPKPPPGDLFFSLTGLVNSLLGRVVDLLDRIIPPPPLSFPLFLARVSHERRIFLLCAAAAAASSPRASTPGGGTKTRFLTLLPTLQLLLLLRESKINIMSPSVIYDNFIANVMAACCNETWIKFCIIHLECVGVFSERTL